MPNMRVEFATLHNTQQGGRRLPTIHLIVNRIEVDMVMAATVVKELLIDVRREHPTCNSVLIDWTL